VGLPIWKSAALIGCIWRNSVQLTSAYQFRMNQWRQRAKKEPGNCEITYDMICFSAGKKPICYLLNYIKYAQNYWVFGLRPSSGIPKTREHNVSEIGYQWLRLALSKGPKSVGVSSSPEDGNRSSFPNAVFSGCYDTGRRTNSNSVLYTIVRILENKICCSESINKWCHVLSTACKHKSQTPHLR
jgi:hypothetical protein